MVLHRSSRMYIQKTLSSFCVCVCERERVTSKVRRGFSLVAAAAGVTINRALKQKWVIIKMGGRNEGYNTESEECKKDFGHFG